MSGTDRMSYCRTVSCLRRCFVNTQNWWWAHSLKNEWGGQPFIENRSVSWHIRRMPSWWVLLYYWATGCLLAQERHSWRCHWLKSCRRWSVARHCYLRAIIHWWGRMWLPWAFLGNAYICGWGGMTIRLAPRNTWSVPTRVVFRSIGSRCTRPRMRKKRQMYTSSACSTRRRLVVFQTFLSQTWRHVQNYYGMTSWGHNLSHTSTSLWVMIMPTASWWRLWDTCPSNRSSCQPSFPGLRTCHPLFSISRTFMVRQTKILFVLNRTSY